MEQVRTLSLRCMLAETMLFPEAPVSPKSKPSVSGLDLEARSSGTDKRQNRLLAGGAYAPQIRFAPQNELRRGGFAAPEH